MPAKLQMIRKGDRELVFTRHFNAPRELVFAAHTQASLIQKWLLGPPGWSMPICEYDARVGGKFRYGWRNNESGAEFGMGGTILELEAPHKIACTELGDGHDAGTEAVTSMVFTNEGVTTRMKMTVRYSSAKACADMVAKGMISGMDSSYELLDDLLTTQPA